MMATEEQKLRCPGCGEAHGGIVTCKDGTSELLDEYVKLVNEDFDDDEEDPDINYEEIMERMTWNGSSYDMGPAFKEKKKNYGLEMKITVLEKRLIGKLLKGRTGEIDKGFSSPPASPDLSETEAMEIDDDEALAITKNQIEIGLQKERENESDEHGIKLILDDLSKSKGEVNSHVFHQVVLAIRNANKLSSWMSECAGVSGIPFHRICEFVEVQEETLDIFSQAGVNFNVLDRQKRNVLFAAITGNQSVSFLKSLIKRGANVNQVDSIGVNLLALAVHLGSADEILEFLISEGVPVNGKRVEYSPMEILVSGCVKNLEKKFSYFKILVNAGAEPKRLQFHEYLKTGVGKEQDFHELVEFIASKGKMEWFNAPGSKEEGETPLLIALSRCKVDVKTLLVMAQAGVDFTKVGSQGHGALACALIGGNWSPPVLQTLINNKADVTLTLSQNKATLLHTAAQVGAPLETLEFLLKKGLRVETEDSWHNTPLEHAVEQTKLTKNALTKLFIWTIDAVAKYSKAEAKAKLSNLLHLAISHGTPDVVEYILKRKVVDVNKADEVGLTPFMFAIGCDKIEDSRQKARLLVQYGADVRKGLEGQTAVHVAAKTGSVHALMYCLIDLRLGVNTENYQGNSPLIDILSENTEEEEEEDEEEGEEEEKELTSSLLEKAECLVLQGADVNDTSNLPPSLLYEHDKVFDTPFHLAVKAYKKVEDEKILEFINCLLDNDADVNGPNLEGFTALHTALDKPDVAVSLNLVKLLDKHGGDFKAKTPTGQTALHLAAQKRNVEMMELCFNKGLDVNDLDKYGKCPLDYIVPTEDEEVDEGACINGMKFLLKNGATKKTKQKVKKEIQKRVDNCKNKKLLEIPLSNLLSLFM